MSCSPVATIKISRLECKLNIAAAFGIIAIGDHCFHGFRKRWTASSETGRSRSRSSPSRSIRPIPRSSMRGRGICRGRPPTAARIGPASSRASLKTRMCSRSSWTQRIRAWCMPAPVPAFTRARTPARSFRRSREFPQPPGGPGC